MSTFIKRTKEQPFVKCFGCEFTFNNGKVIIANEEIAYATEVLWQHNIEVENKDEYKEIYYFYRERMACGNCKTHPKLDITVDWEKSFEEQLEESLSNSFKAMEFGMY